MPHKHTTHTRQARAPAHAFTHTHTQEREIHTDTHTYTTALTHYSITNFHTQARTRTHSVTTLKKSMQTNNHVHTHSHQQLVLVGEFGVIFFEQCEQRPSIDKLHHNVTHILFLPHTKQTHDVGMIQLSAPRVSLWKSIHYMNAKEQLLNSMNRSIKRRYTLTQLRHSAYA